MPATLNIARDMMVAIFNAPGGMTREELAIATGMSLTSSSFQNYLSAINSNGLILKQGKKILRSPEVFDT